MKKQSFIVLVLISVILIGRCSSWRTYDFEEVDVKPEVVYSPKPAYPEEARSAGMEGRVVIDALVNTDGYVAKVKVTESSGYKVLDKAAKEAARDWEFTPAEKDGELVRVWVDIPFNFSLTSG